MKYLFWDQLLYFWQLIRVRFIFWLGLILLAIITLSIQLKGNPRASGFTLFFTGVSFEQVNFPVLWFAYFSIPTLIILNSFQQLWMTRSMHLRGLQFSPINFTLTNVLLMSLLTTIYVAFTIGALAIAGHYLQLTPFSFGLKQGPLTLISLSIANWLGVESMLLLLAIVGRFNYAVALTIPLSLLVITAFTAWPLNPLNQLMLARITNTNVAATILPLVFLTVTVLGTYLVTDRYIKA